MRQIKHILLVALAALCSSVLAVAHAEPVAAAAAFSGVDPNTFILGHPASPRWKLAHVGGEHPAVIVARRAQQPAPIDPNLFVVQPPAAVQWVASGDAPRPTAVAALAR